ncbi:hypothetical protein C8A01DRAFT_21075 [Parachaetomium inaequale]|uniref:Uncharacterized protein n=1 Tax=Parachaetomium inaequale TaxID=2588326 RepID=A0AAN6P4U0_9PEZI|nr:hypothetical protein C8A01DRAFT_21075 [Parachaetomium inaequale]
MRLLPALLLSASVVYACSDEAYRCKNPSGSTSEDWEVTQTICNNLETGTCYCWGAAEDYCDFVDGSSKIRDFQKQCESWGENWYWTQC